MLIFQFGLKRSYFRKSKGEATHKREATRERIVNSSVNLLQPESRVEGEVELNLQGDVHIHIPSIETVQNISKSEPFQIHENFEGGLVDTRQRQNSRIHLQPV